MAFDTLYAEGQRRYVETFSAYTRQFLDRMDKPQVERIDGIPPAIAVDQTNPVRTSRSTVGTMTELNDHLKLLFARASQLVCRRCSQPVTRDTAQSAVDSIFAALGGNGTRLVVTFPVSVPAAFSEEEIVTLLAEQGYRTIHARSDAALDVAQDRTMLTESNRQRIIEAVEAAMQHGHGRAAIWPVGGKTPAPQPYRFSRDLHCARCDIDYRDPVPNLFSFNSPLGACPECRGFGRIIDIDLDLIVPDKRATLAGGAVRPWQSSSYRECQADLQKFARRRGVPLDVAWRDLSDAQRSWVIEGEGEWDDGVWYGVRRFFNWLESRSYKMHIRVLLSRYRAYTVCSSCNGARLKPEALDFRVDGLSIHNLMQLSIDRVMSFFDDLRPGGALDEATGLLLNEIRTRLRYLVEVGVGYLTLDRQSRTLSGGEVQRINLTTALGTSLVNTLFVLDEPSIGLHQRDMRQLILILNRLRDLGNTIVVVEHDPEVIRAADMVIDMGPRAGEHGGEVVFQGSVDRLLRAPRSLTADYLCGRRHVAAPPAADAAAEAVTAAAIEIHGAAEHNLKQIDVALPLQRLVAVTGVSGSGKSTLVQDVLYNALRAAMGRPAETPGRHRNIAGVELIDNVILVDQSAIGKTTRSNPASYVGALDAIRALFAAHAVSLQRGYRAGTFSFNSGNGRCPTCGGNGFEHIEMQFLSDIYVRCPDCSGTRYRPEILDVKLTAPDAAAPDGEVPAAASIADVLAMTVDAACRFFADQPRVLRAMEPLRDVGLGYLRLGQPVPTLSGGEAQRLKLAGHLAQSQTRKGRESRTLFLLDEPTTGLHFDDIEVLLRALRALIDVGHSVVVIEHNLDVVLAADWVVDLGPEGGEAGGHVVACDTPSRLIAEGQGHTAVALRAYAAQLEQEDAELSVAEAADDMEARETPSGGHSDIEIRKAREHNLKGIDLRIPLGELTVITGVSGSGKSTVAFDILFAEGQRRYLESLNAYARQFVQPAARADFDSVIAVPPTVAIEQRTSRGGYKSTVATVTEVYHFLRLLYVKLGLQYCPDCNVAISPQSKDEIAAQIMREHHGSSVSVLAPLVVARKGYYTDLAGWAARKGYQTLRVDGEATPTAQWPRLDRFREHTIELPLASVKLSRRSADELGRALDAALAHGGGVAHVVVDGREQTLVFSTSRACPSCGTGFPDPDPRFFSYNSKHGWCPACSGTGLADLHSEDHSDPPSEQQVRSDGFNHRRCPQCDGTRLRREARAVRYRGTAITELAALPVDAAADYFAGLQLSGREAVIARDIVAELAARLDFLHRVGLGYLPLDRAAPTLSGGESQRIRLAAQLGSNLRGVCYILDEPTIGLHARDNAMLLDTLQGLCSRGNSVVVVEHDEETIRRAQYVIDLGPGGGTFGGEVMFSGPAHRLLQDRRSLTATWLRNPPQFQPIERSRDTAAGSIVIEGAQMHNLKGFSVEIPLARFVAVSGVSGSGKSTLVHDVLHRNLRGLLKSHTARTGTRRSGSGPRRSAERTLAGCSAISGWQPLAYVREVDQTPIGRTPRSTPATYVGIWDAIRSLFAGLPEARMRGYSASRFSFNTAEGRCQQCGGQGVQRIEMNFLPDVIVLCDQCGGKRFTSDTLEVTFKDRSIADVLAMSIDEAADFFEAQPAILHTLQLLQEVGLGYLRLGQQSPTLSGGEAQRIKLVSELAKARVNGAARNGNSGRRSAALYILDEPTIGLHMADVQRLARVIHRLVDAGNTVVVIEHNLDLVAQADWIIDLGPEGGADGGSVVASGPPQRIAAEAASHTGRYLKPILLRRSQS